MIHVVAVITSHPDQRGNILAVAKDNVEVVRAEDGCLEYSVVVDTEFGAFQTKFGKDTFLVIEKWRDEDALRAHAAAPHMITYSRTVKDWIASRVIHVLDSAY